MQADTIGIEMPASFPTLNHNQISSAVSKYCDTQVDVWKEFASAWNGVAYRYSFCCDYSQHYTESVRKNGSSPKQPERYNQEKYIFGFFINGFSTIECFCYGLYALAGLADKNNFPLITPEDKKRVDISKILPKFQSCFPKERITNSLNLLINSNEFKEWSDIRNILSHRSTPGRLFRLGGGRSGQTDWGNIDLNMYTTDNRLQWLTKTLDTLILDILDFIKRNL